MLHGWNFFEKVNVTQNFVNTTLFKLFYEHRGARTMQIYQHSTSECGKVFVTMCDEVFENLCSSNKKVVTTILC